MLNSSNGVCSSRRGPLWVAAFCLKKLKKAQVFDTDISSSVDKILHDEMDVASYRVLAYLLLGVVRIYSKKVEYLFHDCNDVLVRINKFVIKTKVNAPVETLRMSITIPNSFELDALDLDILEDAGGDHIASPEEITLKEVLCNTEGLEQFSQEKFEDFDFGGSSYSSDHLMAQDVHQSHLMNMDFEVFPSNSPINLLASKDISQNSIFSQEEPVNFDTILVVDGIENESANLFGQDQQINEGQTVQKIAPYEDEIHGESRISQEEYMDTSVFYGKEREAVLSVEACTESYQDDNEHNMAKETSSSLCQTHHEIVEVNEARNFQESIERPQDDKSYQEESVHNDKSSVVKESLEELIEGSIEENDKEEKLEFQDKVSLEDGKSSVIPAESKNLDVTPQSRFRGGSFGRPKPGAAPPEFMAISTPAAREGARFSRKRKLVVDEMIVLPNEVLRKSLHDASDLISHRKKNRWTLLTIQRESHISSLPDGFYESLLPCYSSELQSMFSKKTLKIPDSLKIVETLQKLDVSESQIVGSPEHIETAPQTPPRCPDSLVYEETRRKVVAFESQSSGSPDHMATAPETPPLCQNVKARAMKHLERTEIHDKDNLGPSNPHERREREQSLEMNDNLMEEFNAETLNSHESLEREQFFTMDEDLNLMNEEINSCDAENSKLLAGWSERTRKVARYLHKNFLDRRKQRKGDVVNFSHVTGGRTRKECARLFHEILVLRTTSHVDVQQNSAYDDIAISKLPKFDQTFGVDGLF